MQNYSAIVASVLATQFTNPIVPIAEEETGKAQLTRAAAFEISKSDPNVGLRRKTSGNQVANLSVDTIVDRTSGQVVDIATSRPEGAGSVRILPGWYDYGPNPAEIPSYVQPTAALAALPGPMPTAGVGPGPGPDPGPGPGPDDDVIIKMLDDVTQMLVDQASTLSDMRAQQAADTARIIQRDDDNTQSIHDHLGSIVEDMEETLKQALVLILAMRQPGDGGGILPNADELAEAVIAAARERRAARG